MTELVGPRPEALDQNGEVGKQPDGWDDAEGGGGRARGPGLEPVAFDPGCRLRVAATDVTAAAAREEITDKPLRGAREALGVVSRREGFGTGSKVYWSLPTSIDAPELHTGPSPVEGNYGGRGHL